MKKLFKFLVVFLLIIGCTPKEEPEGESCSFEDGDIEWLNLIIDDLEKSNTANKTEIYQYTYNDETVFYINYCVGCNDFIDVVYNCSGEIICEFGGIVGLNTCIDFDTATDEILIWTNINNQVIIDNDRYTNTSTENHQITDVSIEGDILKFSIAASGCSGDSWKVNLIDADVILESLPVQRNIKVDFINNEECEALITKEYEFDISSLQVNGEEIVHFNLEGWDETIVYNYGEQQQDFNELVELFDKIYAMITDVSCEDVEEWSFIAYGAKACGGPQGYLPYPSNIDISVLEAAVEEYTKIEKAYNTKYGIASDCSITPQPTGVNCVNEIPMLTY